MKEDQSLIVRPLRTRLFVLDSLTLFLLQYTIGATLSARWNTQLGAAGIGGNLWWGLNRKPGCSVLTELYSTQPGKL